MSRRLRHHQPASRRLHDVLGLLVTVLVLVCVQLSLSGLSWSGGLPVAGPAASETFGAPASVPQPIALAGPRSLVLVAGLGDGRLRTSQLVEPGASSIGAFGVTLGHASDDAQPRPPLVLARGLHSVRAPPVLAA